MRCRCGQVATRALGTCPARKKILDSPIWYLSSSPTSVSKISLDTVLASPCHLDEWTRKRKLSDPGPKPLAPIAIVRRVGERWRRLAAGGGHAHAFRNAPLPKLFESCPRWVPSSANFDRLQHTASAQLRQGGHAGPWTSVPVANPVSGSELVPGRLDVDSPPAAALGLAQRRRRPFARWA